MNFKASGFLTFAFMLLRVQPILNAPSEVMIDLIAVVQNHILSAKQELDGVKRTMSNLPDYFRMGENFTRVAIVSCPKSNCAVSLDFTDDDAVYKKSLSDLMESPDSSDPILGPALRLVREKLSTLSTRPKAVIVLSRGNLSDLDEAKEETNQLQRNNDTWLYVVTNSIEAKDAFAEILESRTFYVDTSYSAQYNFTAAVLQAIRTDIESMLCNYDQICSYANDSRESCTGGWWNPLIQNDFDCKTTVKAPPSARLESCKRIDCDRVCDRMWPWSSPIKCGAKCGDLNVTRIGAPPKRFLEHCPETFNCVCGRPVVVESESEFWIETIVAIMIGVGMQVIIIIIFVSVFIARKRRMEKRKAREEASKLKKRKLHLTKFVTSISVGRMADSAAKVQTANEAKIEPEKKDVIAGPETSKTRSTFSKTKKEIAHQKRLGVSAPKGSIKTKFTPQESSMNVSLR